MTHFQDFSQLILIPIFNLYFLSCLPLPWWHLTPKEKKKVYFQMDSQSDTPACLSLQTVPRDTTAETWTAHSVWQISLLSLWAETWFLLIWKEFPLALQGCSVVLHTEGPWEPGAGSWKTWCSSAWGFPAAVLAECTPDTREVCRWNGL